MKHILIFGASITHGVGGQSGGWADKVKASLHQAMYGAEGRGEQYGVYELGVPGNTMPDILGRFVPELTSRIHGHKPEDVVVIFSAGTNDSKAVDAADNHLSTPDDFAASVHAFIHLAKDYAATVIGVGVCPIDESKTNPKQNPLRPGSTSFFSNDRIKSFEQAFQRTCDEEGVAFVPLFDAVPADWQQSYLFADGVHPNDRGHEWIRSQVESQLRNLIAPANTSANTSEPGIGGANTDGSSIGEAA